MRGYVAGKESVYSLSQPFSIHIMYLSVWLCCHKYLSVSQDYYSCALQFEPIFKRQPRQTEKRGKCFLPVSALALYASCTYISKFHVLAYTREFHKDLVCHHEEDIIFAIHKMSAIYNVTRK